MEELVNSLNQNNPTAKYSYDNATIVGSWNKSATATGALSQSKINLDYSVIVTLYPDRTYTYTEKIDTNSTNTGPSTGTMLDPTGMALPTQQFDDDSTTLFSSSSNTFRGKTFGTKQKEFTFKFGGKKGQDSYSYDFDASAIKNPLLEALRRAEYKPRKQSIFARLFGL